MRYMIMMGTVEDLHYIGEGKSLPGALEKLLEDVLKDGRLQCGLLETNWQASNDDAEHLAVEIRLFFRRNSHEARSSTCN